MRENRLASETSPYLLQHAHNPVDWYPWGPEALARARREDKPILLSIGYAACHWCHVMERESFEDDAVAALMNEHFVSIKVDREERPDLDDIYMAATMAMTGRGGWPMTVFLAPDQRPFFAGTYFPPERRHGLPGFSELLTRIAEVWQEDRAGVEAQAAQLSEAVRTQLDASESSAIPPDAIAAAVKQLADAYDPEWGGFGRAPKFPPCPALRLLLRHAAHGGDGLALARGTLDGMANGGLYDHVAGGFARYSTDERWHVPHFEKMLYDNGQLARVYVEAFQLTGDVNYRRVAEETLDYLLREMQSPSGGFYSATDADSEGVEGKFFTFTQAELEEILGNDAPAFIAYYGVTAEGNWEHTNVLWTPRPLDEVARSLGLDDLRTSIERSRAAVYAARLKRVPPLLDDKILVSWNGLAIGALAEAARVFGEARYLAAAVRAADDLLARFVRPDGGLYRTARGERVHLDAYLEDYAFLATALVDLYEAGAGARYLECALQLSERMVRDFADTEGGFYQTAHQHEALLARPRDSQDDAMPNANAIAAEACARLAAHFARDDLRTVAERAVQRAGSLVTRSPRSFASTLAVADLLARGPVEVAIVGPEPESEPLRRAVARVYLANRILGYGLGSEALPLLAGKTMVKGAPAVYVCRDFACEAPLTRPEDVVMSLQRRASG
ncbi:MAG TPA: thioredoxin domain-containing protein [Polyangiales bacterium]|nr:thioredoxin domain-containing protein [Polyangiales bacterium]